MCTSACLGARYANTNATLTLSGLSFQMSICPLPSCSGTGLLLDILHCPFCPSAPLSHSLSRLKSSHLHVHLQPSWTQHLFASKCLPELETFGGRLTFLAPGACESQSVELSTNSIGWSIDWRPVRPSHHIGWKA
jgi:hypothetical protein